MSDDSNLVDKLNEFLDATKKAEAESGSKMFLGIPERWYDTGRYRCVNGHVSRAILLCEESPRNRCLACDGYARLTFPEDKEGGKLIRVIAVNEEIGAVVIQVDGKKLVVQPPYDSERGISESEYLTYLALYNWKKCSGWKAEIADVIELARNAKSHWNRDKLCEMEDIVAHLEQEIKDGVSDKWTCEEILRKIMGVTQNMERVQNLDARVGRILFELQFGAEEKCKV